MASISGTSDAAFADVRLVFESLFTEFGETGASVAAVADGTTVVDLWGGTADGRVPWTADTAVNTYSVTKPFAAMTLLHVLASRSIDLDERVATVWPEFATNGKGAVTFRQLAAHQAGLAAYPRSRPDLTDWDATCDALAGMAPAWEPGTAQGEHAVTYGYLLGEVVRRVAGEPTATVLRREITGPLGADFWIGAGDAAAVATVVDPSGDWGARTLQRGNDLYRAALDVEPNALDPAVINTTAWRRADIAAINGHGSARGIARFYAALLDGGAGVVDAGIVREALSPQMTGPDLVMGDVRTWGLGFSLEPDEFGMGGIGGYLGFADAARNVAFGFVTRTLGDFARVDALVDALEQCLGP